MDKNSKAAKLRRPVQDYMKRMYTDTVSPHAAGMRFAIDYYGIDHVMYGTDYPCWDPAACLKLLEDVTLTAAEKQKLFYDNARRIFALKDVRRQKRASRHWCDPPNARSDTRHRRARFSAFRSKRNFQMRARDKRSRETKRSAVTAAA